MQDMPSKNHMDLMNDSLVVHHTFNFKCELCRKPYKMKQGLKSHLLWHSGEGYPCKLCPNQKPFTSEKSFKIHMTWHKNGEPMFTCPEERCGKMFQTKHQLKSHSKSHLEADLPCRIHENCKKFSQENERRLHEQYSDGKSVFACPDCDAERKSPQLLKSHCKRVHGYIPAVIPGIPPMCQRAS